MAKKEKPAPTRVEMAEVLNAWINAHNRDLTMAQVVRKMGALRDELKK